MLHTTLSTTPEWLAYPSLHFVPKWLAYPSLKVLWQVDFYEKFEKSLFACSNWEDWDQYFAKRMGEKAFLLFKINKKKKCFNIINPLQHVDNSNSNSPPLGTCNAYCGVMLHFCTRTVLNLVVSSQFSFCYCLSFFMSARKLLPIFVFKKNEEAKIWWNPQVHHQTRSLALSNRGSYWNQEEWLDKLDDSSPANEAEGQTTTSAHHMKLLENRHHSKT